MSNTEDTKHKKSRFSTMSLSTRLIIGTMLITGIAVIILTYFSFQRRRAYTNYVTTFVGQEVRAQSENLLTETVTRASKDANQFFEEIENEVHFVDNYLTTLFTQNNRFQETTYWNAQEELTRLSENQWGNSTNDPGSVLAPASFELTDETAADINLTTLLDLIAPQMLDANPNIKALYYVSDEGVVNYYPNIDLANIVGDFDARERPYYKAVVPDTNPNKDPFWTVPYYDAADGNLVETHSRPIYDEAKSFRCVVAADVNITTVTDIVETIQVGETGYAFLIDPGGRFIVLPEEALSDFGLGAEAMPEGGIAQRTMFDTQEDIRVFASKMIAGETDLDTFIRDGQEHYFAYAPIESTGYSLGVIVPVDEMNQLYLTINESVQAEETTTFQLTVIIFIGLLVAALVFAYIIGRIITQPLQQLTQAAEQVSAGNFDVEINTEVGGEIGTLAKTFSDMTEQIQDLFNNLGQRVTERTRALEASMEVSRSVSTILEQKQLVAEVAEQVQKAFDYYHVHIYVVDDMTHDLVMAGGTGEAGAALLVGGHTIAAGQGLVGRAAATMSTILVSDVNEEAGWLPNPLLPDTKAEIATPIKIGSQVLGVLDVQQNQAGSLSEVDAQLLELVANQVAIALRNARLYESVQKQAQRETITNMINQKLQSAADIENVLQIAAQELGKALNSQRVTVQLGIPRQDDNIHREAASAQPSENGNSKTSQPGK